MTKTSFLSLIAVLTPWVCLSAEGLPRLHPLFSDHAVLQREAPIPVWGWAAPGDEVVALLGEEELTATADDEGQWMVRFEPRSTGDSLELSVSNDTGGITVKELVMGDVWLCSGQSNMEWPVNRSNDPDEEIAQAKHPGIRLFTVPRLVASEPKTYVAGAWQVCSPETVAGFSAVGYYFGRALHEELEVPIGLLHSSWGGTIAEAWVSLDSLDDMVDFNSEVGLVQAAATGAGAALKPDNPNLPTVLHNGMISSLLPYGIKGAIWYQGESNAGRPLQYRTVLPRLIADWRQDFGVENFPFLIVQLANFMKVDDEPVESNWAALREAQWLTAKNDENVGLAVTIDIGEADDIHPRNKQDVGARLALAARKIAYGEEVVYSGPEFREMKVEDNVARLSFDHIGGGLVAKGDDGLKGFAIAGEDGQFVWADATIEGDEVLVSSPSVEAPKAVRYAWANNPVCNLFNSEGLPAIPFRTDVP